MLDEPFHFQAEKGHIHGRAGEAAGADGDRLIAAFLRATPGWLAAHPDLYVVLEPPQRVHGEAVADHICETLFLQDESIEAVTVKIVKLAISEAGEEIGMTLTRHRRG